MAGYNSNGTFTAGTCVELLRDLTDIDGNFASPFLQRSPLGGIEFLMSSLNTEGTEIIPVQQGDKRKTVRIKYRNRTIESQIREDDNALCTIDDYPDYNDTLFDVTKKVTHTFGLNEDEVALLCEGQGQFIADTLAGEFDAFARKINREYLETQNVNFGINVATGSTASQSVGVFDATTGAPNARALQILLNDYSFSNEASGRPHIIAGRRIGDFLTTIANGCCNDGGVNILDFANSLGAFRWNDVMIDSVLPADGQFVVMQAGRTQFVPVTKYVGERTSQQATFSRGTITDPRTGITYNLKVEFDTCDEVWAVTISLDYDFWFQPDDAFQVDDPLHGVNGTWNYTAVTT